MLHWLTQRRMQGGLVFGPPGWHPQRIEATFEEGGAPETAAPESPANRGALRTLLERLGLGATSELVPALLPQLRELGDRPLQGILLNLLPSQPESALGAALSQLALDEMIGGLTAVCQAAGGSRALVAMDRHDFHSWRRWRRALKGVGKRGAPGRPSLRLLLNRYPQANPTILMWTLLGKRLPVGALPTTKGWLMVDPVACWALGRHLRAGQPFAERPVQLFVQGSEPRLVMGRLGETLQEFARRHAVPNDLKETQVIVNGMLAGWQVAPAKMRLDGRTESITLREPALPEAPAPCISCGWCVDVCPTGLTPVALLELGQRAGSVSAEAGSRILGSRESRESQHCIACGLCTYVCPTRLPLMEKVLELQVRVTVRKGAKDAT